MNLLADHGWIGWIIIGAIAGGIAKAIMPGRDPGGCIVTILLGIAARALAGWLGNQLGWYEQGEGAGLHRRHPRRDHHPVHLAADRGPSLRAVAAFIRRRSRRTPRPRRRIGRSGRRSPSPR
jgi:uncharacterized membrane protein YeaQ/YmgE (transglycosylase-associated protein family)